MEYSKINKLLTYNPDTGVILWKITKGCVSMGQEAGYIRPTKNKKYRVISVNGKECGAHRLAWLLHHKKWPENQIDHIDGNGLNNKISNLRDVTAKENAKNKRLYSRNKSGINGVRWNKSTSKWEAFIKVDLKDKHLGCYKTKIAAAYARHVANIKYGYSKNHGQPD